MFKFFDRSADETPADLRAAIADGEVERAERQAELKHLGDRRLAILKSGDADAVATIDGEIAAVARRLECLDAQLGDLGERLTAAARRESEAAAQATLETARKAQAHGIRLFGRYAKHARAIGLILGELEVVDALMRRLNREVAAAGGVGTIALPNALKRRHRGGGELGTLPGNVLLPEASTGGTVFWRGESSRPRTEWDALAANLRRKLGGETPAANKTTPETDDEADDGTAAASA
ncbi:hypothetical protein HY633_01285 [Candidatus Uhrbacteria bacterium]|nr:hypothetical protein [Candidatus Uhrbacteria bacterium]